VAVAVAVARERRTPLFLHSGTQGRATARRVAASRRREHEAAHRHGVR